MVDKIPQLNSGSPAPLSSHKVHFNFNQKFKTGPEAGTFSGKNLFMRRFSLVELLVVISIILLITTVATVGVVPMMRGRRLRSGARAVQTVIRQARSYAAHSSRDTEVRFDHDEGFMEIYAGAQIVFERRYLPVGIEFDGPHDHIRFSPMGDSGTGVTTITLLDEQNDLDIDIKVIGSSGLVRVE